MANMGYCRFRNTLEDLRDCEEHIHDDRLSEDEARARKRLIAACRSIVNETDEEKL